MYGISFSFYSPRYFWVGKHPIISVLYWLFRLSLNIQARGLGSVALRIAGLELGFHFRTTGYVRREREKEKLQEKMAEFFTEMAEKFAEKRTDTLQKDVENAEKAQKSAENGEKPDENVKKVAYQAIAHSSTGFTTISVENEGARAMISGENFAWTMEQVEHGARLIVSDKDHVNTVERSFTLPGYENQGAVEIGHTVIFGNKDDHLRTKVQGYREGPDGERTFFYAPI